MKSFVVAFWVEVIKTRKSRIFWASFLFFILVSSMMGLIMFVQIYPEISGKLGMIGTKASLFRFGEPNWQNYFALLIQGFAGVGMVGIGFITSWVFGREFSDKTVKDILALPVSRDAIVLAKFVVIVIWSILLTVVFYISGMLIGFAIGLPGWTGAVIFQSTETYFITALLTIFLCTPVAFFASYSRGYIVPMAFVILTLILANFTGLVGLGPYFPWSIPGLYGVASGDESMQLTLVSPYILLITSLLGLGGTLFWWRFADQK